MAEHIVSIDSFLAEWAAAEQAGDTDTLEGLLADDFVGIGPLGFSLPKAEWLARYRQGLHYDAFDLEETQVRTYGDVAVVTARNNQSGTYYGNPIPEAVRATCIAVRSEGRWQLAAIHLSFIAGTAGAPPIPGAPGPAASETDQA
jgi:ketosteroid isomerase-like protein